MNFSAKCVVALLAASHVDAFVAPQAQVGARAATSQLSISTLDDWQLLENGSVVGSVQGHPTLNDGDVITTSPLSNPGDAVVYNTVVTVSGSEYLLGSPLQMKARSAPAASATEAGTMDRGTLIKGAGLASLVAGGFALGLGVGGGGGGSSAPAMTVPEAKIAASFSGALANADLIKKISPILAKYGYGKTTMVATSLCCDEVNRPLEKALAGAYDEPFVMGGLAGFPFGGVTSFGAMAHHIPDGGSCLVVYGPHVGIDQFGTVGTVNRRGRAKGGACCGSAAAALGKIRKGAMVPPDAAAPPPPPATDSLDAQQAYVNAQLAPYGERLLSAEDRNVELPFALYEAQKIMMDNIVAKGAGALEGDGNIALLGGIQINTPEGISDYFLPLSFELRDKEARSIDDLMWTA